MIIYVFFEYNLFFEYSWSIRFIYDVMYKRRRSEKKTVLKVTEAITFKMNIKEIKAITSTVFMITFFINHFLISFNSKQLTNAVVVAIEYFVKCCFRKI